MELRFKAKVFFSVDSQPPNSFWPYQKFSEGYLSFFFFFEDSFYPLDIILCLLVVPTRIIQWKVTLYANSTVEDGKDRERWSWFVQIDSNNNSIKSWIKHIHPVLCHDPKNLLAHFSHKSECQDVSQMEWLWQAPTITQGAWREMLIF